MRSQVASIIVGLGLLAAPSWAAAETVLQNDSLEEMFNGTTSAAQLIEGETYEVTFDIPEAWLPVEMLGVRVVMVENPQAGVKACGRFGIDVWEESAAAPMSASCIGPSFNTIAVGYKDPGTQIFTQDSVIDPQTSTVLGFEVRGDPDRGTATFKDLRFSAVNQIQGVTINPVMIDTTRVRVAVRALDLQCTAGGMIGSGDHFPVLLSDLDGVSAAERNFVYGEPLLTQGVPLCSNVSGPQHYLWEDFGPAFQNSQPGDFIFRLILNHDEGNNTMPDMGMSTDMGMSSDMGTTPADMGSAMDMGTPPADVGVGTNGLDDAGAGALMITSVTPEEGDNATSTDIVIVGSGFQSGAEVLLDARNIGVTETQSGRIRATVPEGLDPDVYDLIVTNPDGETAILMNGFTVTEGPTSSDDKSASSSGCCSQIHGGRQGSGLGFALIAGMFALVTTSRRRRRR